MRLALFGATGRMGLSITRLTENAPDVQIVGAVCAIDDPGLGRDVGELAGIGTVGVATTADLGSGLLGADVVIDFSTSAAAPILFMAAAREGVNVVSGTTGLGGAGLAALERAAQRVALLWAPNMSLGVQVLAELSEIAARRLGSAFDVEILEVHHRSKTDAPSGTARRLAEAVRAGRPELVDRFERAGDVGARKPEELGVFGVRGGDVVGDHTVLFLGQGERLELVHRASSRDLFANGALRAARFLAGKPKGRYAITDVLDG